MPPSCGLFVCLCTTIDQCRSTVLLSNATFGPWLDLPSQSTNGFVALSSENCCNEKLTLGRTINCFCSHQAIYTKSTRLISMSLSYFKTVTFCLLNFALKMLFYFTSKSCYILCQKLFHFALMLRFSSIVILCIGNHMISSAIWDK